MNTLTIMNWALNSETKISMVKHSILHSLGPPMLCMGGLDGAPCKVPVAICLHSRIIPHMGVPVLFCATWWPRKLIPWWYTAAAAVLDELEHVQWVVQHIQIKYVHMSFCTEANPFQWHGLYQLIDKGCHCRRKWKASSCLGLAALSVISEPYNQVTITSALIVWLQWGRLEPIVIPDLL